MSSENSELIPLTEKECQVMEKFLQRNQKLFSNLFAKIVSIFILRQKMTMNPFFICENYWKLGGFWNSIFRRKLGAMHTYFVKNA